MFLFIQLPNDDGITQNLTKIFSLLNNPSYTIGIAKKTIIIKIKSEGSLYFFYH